MITCSELSRRQADALRLTGSDDNQFVAHAADCRQCSDALRAMRAINAERMGPVPKPPEGATERAIAAAVLAPTEVRRSPGGFWAGLALGAAAAIALVAIILMLRSPIGIPAIDAPQVTLALNQSQDVSIAIDSLKPLKDAEIHVMLRGDIDLFGYEGQRDVHWITDLDRGVNELTLPVVAKRPRGGELVVEVHHAGKRKSFHVAVRALLDGDSV